MNPELIQNFAEGYYYQDCVSALIVSRSLFLSDQILFIADKKDENLPKNGSDIVDDLKILYPNHKICFQIKHSNEKALEIKDFSAEGQLSLKKLLKYDKCEETSGTEYVFVLRWAAPTDDTKKLLIPDPLNFSKIDDGCNCVFNLGKILDIRNSFNLEDESMDDVKNLIGKIHLVIDAPDISKDWNNPKGIEEQLIDSSLRLGAEKFPNQNTSRLNFCIAARGFLNAKRASKDHQFNIDDFLKSTGLQKHSNFVLGEFEIDKNIYVSQEEEASSIIDCVICHKITILFGEPGSGKSYLTSEIRKELSGRGIKNAQYDIYANSDKSNKLDQINPDALVESLINQTCALFKTLSDDRLNTYSKTIETLKIYDSLIKEKYIFVIDGLDHAFREYENHDDLSKLKNTIIELSKLENVQILIVSQPLDFLRNIPNSKILQIQKWGSAKVRKLASKFNLAIPEEEIAKIENKSEGNPLYISYLLKSSPDGIDLCPQYSGSIENYYSYLTKSEKDFQILMYVALIPFYFSKEDLVAISNRGEQTKDLLRRIEPLLKFDPVSNGYLIYHESFKRFVLKKCEENGTNPKTCLNDIIRFLKSKDFYQDDKAYWHLLNLLCETEKYDECLNYCNYDYLFKSVYYGRSVRATRSNLDYFRKAACEQRSYDKLNTYFLLSRTLSGQFDDLFYGADSPYYQNLFLTLFGVDYFQKCIITNTTLSNKQRNLVVYTLLSNKINIDSSFAAPNEKYSEYESNIGQRIFLLEQLKAGMNPISFNEKAPLNLVAEITDELIKQKKVQIIDPSRNLLARLYLNATSLKNSEDFSELKPSFDGRGKSVYQENYALLLLNFISFIQYHLDDEEAKTISCHCNRSFYDSLLKLILDNKKAVKLLDQEKDQDQLEKCLIANLIDFNTRTSNPFRGTPRAVDFSERVFKGIFLRQLIVPVTYLKSQASIKAFLETLLKTCNNLSTSLMNTHSGCISLEDIFDVISPLLTKENRSVIAETLEQDIINRLPWEIYFYDAEYCFWIGNLFSSFSIDKAKEYYSKGVFFILGYGDHKDIFMSDVLSIYQAALKENIEIKSETERQLGNYCCALLDHTDGRETSEYCKEWLTYVSQQNDKKALRYIIDYQLQNGVFNENKEVFCQILNKRYAQIDLLTLYHIISCYDLTNFPTQTKVYIYLVSQLAKKRKEAEAMDALSLLIDQSRNYQSDKKTINSVNKLIEKIMPDWPRIQYIKTERSTPHCENDKALKLDPAGFLKCKSLGAYTPKSITETLKKIAYNEQEKRQVIYLFNNYDVRTKIETLVSRIKCRDIGQDNYVFLNTAAFIFATDGWGKMFDCPRLFQNAYEVDQNLCQENFFKNVQSVDPYYGFGGMVLALSKYPAFKGEIKRMFANAFDITTQRCFNSYRYFTKQSKADDSSYSLLVQELCLSILKDSKAVDDGAFRLFINYIEGEKNLYSKQIKAFIQQNKKALSYLDLLE